MGVSAEAAFGWTSPATGRPASGRLRSDALRTVKEFGRGHSTTLDVVRLSDLSLIEHWQSACLHAGCAGKLEHYFKAASQGPLQGRLCRVRGPGAVTPA